MDIVLPSIERSQKALKTRTGDKMLTIVKDTTKFLVDCSAHVSAEMLDDLSKLLTTNMVFVVKVTVAMQRVDLGASSLE